MDFNLSARILEANTENHADTKTSKIKKSSRCTIDLEEATKYFRVETGRKTANGLGEKGKLNNS